MNIEKIISGWKANNEGESTSHSKSPEVDLQKSSEQSSNASLLTQSSKPRESQDKDKDKDKVSVSDAFKLRLGYNQIVVNSSQNTLLPLLIADNYTAPNFQAIIEAVQIQTLRLFTNTEARYNALSGMALTNLGVIQRTWTFLALKIIGVPVNNEPFCYVYESNGLVDAQDLRFILAYKYSNTALPNLPEYSADKGVLSNHILLDVLTAIEPFILDLRARITGDLFKLNCYCSFQMAKGAGLSNPNIAVQTRDIDYRLLPEVFQNIDSNSLVAAGEKIYDYVAPALPHIAIDEYLTYDNNIVIGVRNYMRVGKPVIMVFQQSTLANVDKEKSAKLSWVSELIHLAHNLGKLMPSKLNFQGLFIEDEVVRLEKVRRLFKSSIDRFVGKSVPGLESDFGSSFITGSVDCAYVSSEQDSSYTDITFSLDKMEGRLLAANFRQTWPILPFALSPNGEFLYYDQAETRFALFQDREDVDWICYLNPFIQTINDLALYASDYDLRRLPLSLRITSFGHLNGHYGLLGTPKNNVDWQAASHILCALTYVALALVNPGAALHIYSRLVSQIFELSREVETLN